MKIGFCMLLWTTHVTEKHRPILEDLKATGYDGVEIPVFEGTPDHYASDRPDARRDRARPHRDHRHPDRSTRIRSARTRRRARPQSTI